LRSGRPRGAYRKPWQGLLFLGFGAERGRDVAGGILGELGKLFGQVEAVREVAEAGQTA
jgi:hypothetical protein